MSEVLNSLVSFQDEEEKTLSPQPVLLLGLLCQGDPASHDPEPEHQSGLSSEHKTHDSEQARAEQALRLPILALNTQSC
jgi:hypothetical protein